MIVACVACGAILSTLWRNQCLCGPECMKAWNKRVLVMSQRSIEDLARVTGVPVEKICRSVDPHNIKHVVVATQSDPDAFATELKTGLDDLRDLFEIVKPSSRSIEPHKKRREK